jgi:hypothetical protein
MRNLPNTQVDNVRKLSKCVFAVVYWHASWMIDGGLHADI